ncbi:efflux RND transporter periplasmic adaptor subunit [Myxococcota bacterium]|nr:efflux RND transporter periplasmic adaptor subunit [Myxococcota bacterium]
MRRCKVDIGRSVKPLAWFVALAMISAGCNDSLTPRELAPTSVSLAPVRSVSIEELIDASGELIAKDSARVAAEVSGRVTEVLVEEGSPVESGQSVLTIDPERRQLELDTAMAELGVARANLHEAQRELNRVTHLRERTVASQTVLEQAQTALELANSRVEGSEARVQAARRAVADATVRSPFAGVIGRRFVSRGEFVNTGDKLFDLFSLDPVEVEFHVAERDSSRVRLGQTVAVTVAPYPDEIFDAVVSMVSPVIDPMTRTLRVKALVTNTTGRLRPGLFARVDLGIAYRPHVTIIPEDAILQRADGVVVFRYGSDQRVNRVVIDIGNIRDGLVEVVEGLSVGEIVVERGHSRLVDGELVTARDTHGNLVEVLPPVAATPES